MKKYFLIAALAVLGFSLVQAQLPSAGLSPGMSEAMTKVFGTNLYYSATLHTEVSMPSQGQNVSMTGKMYFSGGNSRSEIDMTQMSGNAIPPQAIAQMKSMGMDKMVAISQSDLKMIYMVYPGLKAYAKMQEPDASTSTNNVKVDSSELGKETMDGHPCVKKQFMITDPTSGQQVMMITWNATDLKGIPIEVQQTAPGKDAEGTNSTTMHFTDIDLTKPDPNLFVPPAGYTAYNDVQTMMQTEMMKKVGGGAGLPQ
jgi:hypothetical protein